MDGILARALALLLFSVRYIRLDQIRSDQINIRIGSEPSLFLSFSRLIIISILNHDPIYGGKKKTLNFVAHEIKKKKNNKKGGAGEEDKESVDCKPGVGG